MNRDNIMKFCPECSNILYYNEKENQLMNFCKICGFEDTSDEVLIQNKYYKNTSIGRESRKNYIYDPTYARTIHYICPNIECKTHNNEEIKEAIFFNETNSLKQVFLCKSCQTEWKY